MLHLYYADIWILVALFNKYILKVKQLIGYSTNNCLIEC